MKGVGGFMSSNFRESVASHQGLVAVLVSYPNSSGYMVSAQDLHLTISKSKRLTTISVRITREFGHTNLLLF